MRSDAHTKLLNLERFDNSVALFLLRRSMKDFEISKKIENIEV